MAHTRTQNDPRQVDVGIGCSDILPNACIYAHHGISEFCWSCTSRNTPSWLETQSLFPALFKHFQFSSYGPKRTKDFDGKMVAACWMVRKHRLRGASVQLFQALTQRIGGAYDGVVAPSVTWFLGKFALSETHIYRSYRVNVM